MGTSVATLSGWFDEGVAQGATHMVVVCDTYDWTDYPVYVTVDQDVRKVAEANNGPNMTRLMEVYNLSMSKAAQMAQHRAFNY